MDNTITGCTDHTTYQKGNRTKEFHDFFTPEEASRNAFKGSKHILKKPPYINRLLEPSVGSGNLIWPFLESEFLIDFAVIDIQESYLNDLKKVSEEKGYYTYLKDKKLHITNTIILDEMKKDTIKLEDDVW